VIAETLAGICLGPSVLGLFAPGLQSRILPPGISPALGVLAQLGVIIFMFQVGLELDLSTFRRNLRNTFWVAGASIALPFSLGIIVAILMYASLSNPGIPQGAFVLFFAVSLSVTAFPVLARILRDTGIQKTNIGQMALSCAAINDVAAWCLLALSVAVARAESTSAMAGFLGCLLLFGIVLAVLGPRLAQWFAKWPSPLPAPVVTLLFLALLLSALATQVLGLHAIFGAFLLGALIPHDSALAKEFDGRLPVVNTLLLPAFFAYTGLRMQADFVSGWTGCYLCLAIILVATLGKLGGTALAARYTGYAWRDALSLGALMNTRGLVELIVLNVGLDLKIISPALFSILVCMAIVTTLATVPLLRYINPKIFVEAS
jgi:Kef-type K+ transport system membrane component KefB